MLVYGKKVENSMKLFGTTGSIPAVTDSELTYLDEAGNALTIVANDTYKDASSGGTLRIKRLSDGKFVNVFVGETQIIGDTVQPAPVVVGQKHTIRMTTNDGTDDVAFDVTIENESETKFTSTTLEAWLAAGGYTTAASKYYENVVNVVDTDTKVTGIASKGAGAIVCELQGGSGTDATFVSDTVVPANA